jgi:hypothetical protein
MVELGGDTDTRRSRLYSPEKSEVVTLSLTTGLNERLPVGSQMEQKIEKE